MNFRFSGHRWDIDGVKPPWGDRPSIFGHILTHIRPGEPGLGEKGDLLPDEEIVRGDKEIAWVPGALDGVIGHHADTSETAEIAGKILESLLAFTRKATDERASTFYSLLLQEPALTYLDALLEALVSTDNLDVEKVHTIASWLATSAADREPVKCAIALLGVSHGGDDRDLLLTLGRHEEFTLFASVALQNSDEEAELSLWALAILVTGWGRVQIIERLAETRDEQIKAWMLRDGYQNDIMCEYTALVCARTGDLLSALRKPVPDNKLLKGAGSILTALIRGRGGPSSSIDSYPEGAEAAELYLTHLQTREIDLQDLVDVSTIHQFLKEGSAEAKDPALGWIERGAKLLGLASVILSRSDWEPKVHEGLGSEDRQIFWTATEAARLLRIDAWEVYFDRLQRGEDQWFSVMQTDNEDRVDRVIEFAQATLPLHEIASGPADILGLGPGFQDHIALDYILQELRRFPGKGWPLIRAGLQSPTVCNRNMALMALRAWERTDWPGDAELLLRQATEIEPNDKVRETMTKALAGESDEQG